MKKRPRKGGKRSATRSSVTENTTWRNRRSGELPALQRIFSSFIHAQERASRLIPNYPQIFSLFFRHYRYQAARVAEESFRAHSRRRSKGQIRTTAAAQHRTGGRRRGAAFSMRAATARRRAGKTRGGGDAPFARGIAALQCAKNRLQRLPLLGAERRASPKDQSET